MHRYFSMVSFVSVTKDLLKFCFDFEEDFSLNFLSRLLRNFKYTPVKIKWQKLYMKDKLLEFTRNLVQLFSSYNRYSVLVVEWIKEAITFTLCSDMKWKCITWSHLILGFSLQYNKEIESKESNMTAVWNPSYCHWWKWKYQLDEIDWMLEAVQFVPYRDREVVESWK